MPALLSVWTLGKGSPGVVQSSRPGKRGSQQRTCLSLEGGVRGGGSSCPRRYRGMPDASGGGSHRRSESCLQMDYYAYHELWGSSSTW